MNRGLTINGKTYTEEELILYCQNLISNSVEEWERDYCRFIVKWLNNFDEVSAKTSGSTGTPKQIKLSKQKMINSARLTGEYFGFKEGDTALFCLSSNFIAGKMMIVRAFVWQLNLIPVSPNGHPLENVNLDFDFAAMIPLQVKNSLLDQMKMDRVKNLLIGGGVVDLHLSESLQLVKTNCFVGYGMTETVSHVAIRSLNGENKSDLYSAMGNAKFITDERSCLCIESSAVLDHLLLTNDVVELVNEKKFKWLGRYDHVINSGGIKLFPEQLELKLQGIIQQAFFLVGIPDAHLGEKMILLIEDENCKEEKRLEIRRQIKSLFVKYEQAREIFYISEFKRTETGKIQREATLEEFILSR